MSQQHDPIVITSSDVEDDEIAFVRSTQGKQTVSRLSQTIVVDSDSDSDEKYSAGIGIHSLVSSNLPIWPDNGDLDMALQPLVDLDVGPSTSRSPRARRPETYLNNSTGTIESPSHIAAESKRLSREERLVIKENQKRAKELAKAAAKAEKEAEKSFQRKLLDVNKLRTTKSDTVRDIRLYLSADLSLPSSPIAGALPEIEARVKESSSDIHFLSEDETTVPGSLRIKRHIKALWDTPTKRFVPVKDAYWEWDQTALILAHAEEIVDKLSESEDSLANWIQDARLLLQLKPEDQIIIVINGLGKYQAKTRTLANREYTAAARAGLGATASISDHSRRASRIEKEDIDRGLVAVQVRLGVFIVQVERTTDMEDWIWNLCADAALRPYKLLSKSHLSFAATDIKRKASESTEVLELMLQEVQGVTASAAAGIAAEYPTFVDLMRAFEQAERRGGEARAEGLLADCEIRNLKNGAASGRRLNKALAKRVYQLFRGEDSLALA